MSVNAEFVRLNKTPFSGRWEVVRLAEDGRTITNRWQLHPDDAALLERVTSLGQTDH